MRKRGRRQGGKVPIDKEKGKKARGPRLKGLTIIRTVLSIPRFWGPPPPQSILPLAESKKASCSTSDQWFDNYLDGPSDSRILGSGTPHKALPPLPRAEKLPITPQINGFDNQSDSFSDPRILGSGTPHKASPPSPPCREQASCL